jgi:hypothetical protein
MDYHLPIADWARKQGLEGVEKLNTEAHRHRYEKKNQAVLVGVKSACWRTNPGSPLESEYRKISVRSGIQVAVPLARDKGAL